MEFYAFALSMYCHRLGRLYLVLVNNSIPVTGLVLGGREVSAVMRWESRLEVKLSMND